MEPPGGSPHERRRIGVLGGTFDPIHVGHLVAASEALHRVDLDEVLLVPAGRPWQKMGYADGEDRLVMATLAAASHPHLSVSRIELDRKGPTYTVDTLRTLTEFYPQAELFFMVGADAVREMHTWHEVGEVAQLAQVVAVTRPGHGVDPPPVGDRLPRVLRLDIPGIDVSSTMIRARVATGAPIDYLVTAEVARFIRQRGLYSSPRQGVGDG